MFRPTDRLANVQALRGLAALVVLAAHVSVHQVTNDGVTGAGMLYAARVLQSFGHVAVDVFFVISGLVIFTVAGRASRSPTVGTPRLHATAHFVWRRVLRIYPLYWVTAAAMLALTTPAPEPHTLGPAPPLLLQLSLATRWIPIHPVAWTLVFQMYFYMAAACCLLAFGPRMRFGLALWVAAEAVLIGFCSLTPDADAWLGAWRDSVVLDPIALEFGLGCAVGAAVARPTHMPVSVALLAAGIPVLWGGWQLYGQPTPGMSSWFRLVYFGTGAALLVYGAAVLDRHGQRVAPHWLRAIGDASYSLYLWHVPVVMALAAIGRRLPLGWTQGGTAMAVLECAAALVVARWSYRWIEQPMLGRITTSAVESTDQARAA